MANDTPSNILKRIIFISSVLGMMFGLGLVLILRAIFKPDLSLLVVVLPMFIIAIPMVVTLMRLGKTIDRTS
jgi:hypothetical protein